MTRTRLLRFGVFEMDLEARELRRRGLFVPLPPQPFAVLAELATRGGQVVSREDLQALLWPVGVVPSAPSARAVVLAAPAP
jgi:DNA-binding response OmpR family regulator